MVILILCGWFLIGFVVLRPTIEGTMRANQEYFAELNPLINLIAVLFILAIWPYVAISSLVRRLKGKPNDRARTQD